MADLIMILSSFDLNKCAIHTDSAVSIQKCAISFKDVYQHYCLSAWLSYIRTIYIYIYIYIYIHLLDKLTNHGQLNKKLHYENAYSSIFFHFPYHSALLQSFVSL